MRSREGDSKDDRQYKYKKRKLSTEDGELGHSVLSCFTIIM